MPDASPTKWHLAHTTWFFETFILAPRVAGYRTFDPHFGYLFNSYYEAVGPRLERAARGLLTRPSLEEVRAYRRHVDEATINLAEQATVESDDVLVGLIELGLHHEQQHQELLLTDIKHALAGNPLRPPYQLSVHPLAESGLLKEAITGERALDLPADGAPEELLSFEGGLIFVGHDGAGFAFDNEGPRHQTFLRPFSIADRPVTCGAYLAFMQDGGYQRPALWLSDGWHICHKEGWRAPLYWEEREGHWTTYTLGGMRTVDAREPVVHVSYYEADAFARWANARLPTEEEWEHAAVHGRHDRKEGHFADRGHFHPMPARAGFFGDVWQWTSSPYRPYPGYRSAAGALGEYNGKFMCNQMVLRGGSCLTPQGHVTATYRNFFPPDARWQASGFRLARDA